MTREELHERCEHLRQTLIDLIAAVLDLQDSQEWEHLQGILETAQQVVQDDVPPVSAEASPSAEPGGGWCEHPPPSRQEPTDGYEYL